LDALGIFDATTGMWRHLLTALIALVSIAIALIIPSRVHWAGLIYFPVGPVHATFGYMRGTRRERAV
jgi:hypothetical protein